MFRGSECDEGLLSYWVTGLLGGRDPSNPATQQPSNLTLRKPSVPARLVRLPNGLESGSPPCSPQTPTFSLALALRPRSVPSRTSCPTPTVSIDSKGSFGRIFLSTYSGSRPTFQRAAARTARE